MANLLDYIDWRGDLLMGQSPFNEVDNLILSELSYLDFGGVVPGTIEGAPVTVAQAAEEIFERYPAGEKINMGLVVPDQVPDMLKKMAKAPRFQNMRLMYYVDHVDSGEAEQFSAVTIDTGDGHFYCAFRGTDDTLAGWREDLELACVPEVPAQKMAVTYFNHVARQHRWKKFRLGGHSKGGNLAVYAGVFCAPAVQKRILDVWSNDGPGFHNDILSLQEHKLLADRIHTIVPKSSIVGMLLEHEETYTVVDSDELGIWQHDGFSWQVMGSHFITLPGVSEQATIGGLAVRDWVKNMSVEQRNKFVDALFNILTASGAETLTDLKEENIRAVGPMLKAMKDLDKDTRDGLWDFIQLMLTNNARMVLEDIQDHAQKLIPPGRKLSERTKKESL